MDEVDRDSSRLVFERVNFGRFESTLSIGCGPGFETAALAEHLGDGRRVVGIDVNEEVLARARDRCENLPQVSFEKSDITDLPVTDGSHDLVVAKQVLSEVSDPESAIDELFRLINSAVESATNTR